jgi:hypothetical protein
MKHEKRLNTEGHVFTRSDEIKQLSLWEQGMFVLAGGISQYRSMDSERLERFCVDGEYFYFLRKLEQKLGSKELAKIATCHLGLATYCMLRAYREAVKNVAEQLMTHRRLSYSKVKKIIEGSRVLDDEKTMSIFNDCIEKLNKLGSG